MSQKQMSQGCFPGLLQAGGATALPCALPPVPKEHRTRVRLPREQACSPINVEFPDIKSRGY